LLATPPWFKPPRPKRFEADLTPLGGVADVQTADNIANAILYTERDDYVIIIYFQLKSVIE
jgi:hypothetical protein